MAKGSKRKPGVSAAKGKGRGGTPSKVQTSGGGNAYSGGTGIVRETSTKKAGRGRYSK